MTVLNWSEFPRGPNGHVDQCSECAYLAGLSWGGVSFHRGEYNQLTRDDLTRAIPNRDARRAAGEPAFDMINPASAKLFGHRLRPVSGTDGVRSSDALLAKALRTPGNLVVVPGNLAGLPYDHPLRARARAANGSDYAGSGKGHMLAFPNDAGTIGCLDPLQKWRTAPYVWTGNLNRAISDVLAFAYNWSDAHVVRRGEFAPLPDTALEEPMIDVKTQRPVASVIVKGGSVYRDADRAKGVLRPPITSPIRLQIYARPTSPTLPGGKYASLVPGLFQLSPDPADLAVGGVGYDQVDWSSLQPVGWELPQPDCGPLERRIGNAAGHLADASAALKTAEAALAAGTTALKG